ncbi:hypothetical protein [Achromobacter sp. Bel]|uniref:hypothetical protein n=1 Tax=Achromobacter sp. Bel TaxID=2727415 RepID=UPI001B7D4AB4|nr:hypothetical protein [Achromobacter sp. Bel]
MAMDLNDMSLREEAAKTTQYVEPLCGGKDLTVTLRGDARPIVGCASGKRIGLNFDVKICRLLSRGLRDLNESRIRHTPGLITVRFKIRYENEKQESTALRHAIWRVGQK